VQIQLEFVKDYLAAYVGASSQPKVITLDVGGNDLLLLQDDCQLPSFLATACMLARLPFYEHGYKESLRTLFESIAASGYEGPTVVLTTYVPNYGDWTKTFAIDQYNGALRDAAEDA